MLLERDRLTSGTTWHAAGLMVTFGSTSETSTEMRKYTRDLYARLEAETGQATGFKPVGFIEVAADAGPARGVPPGRRRSTGYCGVDVHEISPARGRASCSRSRAPTTSSPASTSKDDGRANPVDVTMALAKGARHAGRADRRGRAGRPASCTQRRRGHRRAHRRTATSRPSTSSTAPACGRASSASATGVTIPLQAAEHYYLITEPIAGVSRATGRCSRTRRRTATSARRSAA